MRNNPSRYSLQKVYMAVLLGIWIGSILFGLYFLLLQLKQKHTTLYAICKAKSLLGEARRAEKDFLIKDFNNEDFIRNGQSTFYEKNQYIRQQIDTVVNELQAAAIGDRGDSSMTQLRSHLVQYDSAFHTIGHLYRERGFNDMGLEGQMRVAIYFVEEANFPTDKTDLLLLRREEKDFFLRKDKHYIETFTHQLSKFQQKIDSIIGGGKSPEIGDHVKAALETYGVVFFKIVGIEKQVGLDENEGLRKSMNVAYEQIQINLNVLASQQQQQMDFRMLLMLILIVLLVVSFVGAISMGVHYFRTLIQRPLIQMESVVGALAVGNTQVTFESAQTPVYMAGLSGATHQLVQKLQKTTQYLDTISADNLAVQITCDSDKDQINQSLIHLTTHLQELQNQQQRQNWTNVGYTAIAQILQKNADIETIAYEVLKAIIAYVHANQGALFTETPDEEALEMVACVAFDKKKFHQKYIDKSVGLVGQCWKEGQHIYLKQVPENYISITSGLGESTPRSVLLVPLISNHKKEGVLELASFRYFESHEIAFLEKVGESIAAAFTHLKMVQQLQENKNNTSL